MADCVILYNLRAKSVTSKEKNKYMECGCSLSPRVITLNFRQIKHRGLEGWGLAYVKHCDSVNRFHVKNVVCMYEYFEGDLFILHLEVP